MSSNVYEDPNLTVNVRYSKGVRADGGVKVERVVDIYESAGTVNDRHVDYSTQDGGAHTQKRLSIVQRNSFRAAALILGLLLVVAVIVLSKLYISASFDRLSNRYEKLQTAYEELKNSSNLILQLENISVTLEKDQLQTNYSELSNSLKKLHTAYEELKTSSNDDLCGIQRNPEGWKRLGCSCYYKSTEMKNWTESRKDCQDSGADLVTINNNEEQKFLWELDKHGDFWVGLQSVKKPNNWNFEWEWVDTSKPGYEGWRLKVNIYPLEGSTGYIDLQGTLQHTNNGSKQWICEKHM